MTYEPYSMFNMTNSAQAKFIVKWQISRSHISSIHNTAKTQYYLLTSNIFLSQSSTSSRNRYSSYVSRSFPCVGYQHMYWQEEINITIPSLDGNTHQQKLTNRLVPWSDWEHMLQRGNQQSRISKFIGQQEPHLFMITWSTKVYSSSYISRSISVHKIPVQFTNMNKITRSSEVYSSSYIDHSISVHKIPVQFTNMNKITRSSEVYSSS